ncbi:GNAT family N-acetyltransferase [Pontibacter anaerobius]|uniref:GNAT family N-acetyltransferase n=1 Tax=Pontibacter anaerobius TaxID=2993940 RepID=A0ABT3RK39_9BACT|nr:GNAT family N-acetyltransferase [Pontibacter anaerobius]MCX2741748.1 GNAT family N-acetyltransferase [Pontibacter anaerobius]
MKYEIIHEEKYQQFTARLEQDEEAEIAYSKPQDGVLDLTHTFVPDAYRGSGLAQALINTALAYARRHNLKVIATCMAVKKHIEQNPEHQDLLR